MLSSNITKKGSVILIALGMGVVLMLLIGGIFTFSSSRTQTTIQISQNAKALALAEAGLEFAINELYHNYGFETHKVSKDLKWLSTQKNKTTIKDNSSYNLSLTNSSNGTYGGTLGDGEFKVRIGKIPYKDNKDTPNINESESYLFTEAIGRYKSTVRKITAVINRRFPAREFLLYDGGILSLVYGEPGKNNTNIFSTGHLYGDKGVEIGPILMSRHSPRAKGTKQELDDMEAIISGQGGIYFYDNVKVKFRNQSTSTIVNKNANFPTNGTYANPASESFGALPQELIENRPTIPTELKQWLVDKEGGISLAAGRPQWENLEASAKTSGGIFLNDSDCNETYPVTRGWPGPGKKSIKVKVLDFGNNIHQSKVNLPPNFNGTIFAEGNLVIKGNPPQDIAIAAKGNIFVAGDFNQGGDPNRIDEFYGLPQDYKSGGNALKSANYSSNIQERLKNDADATPGTFKNHVAAKVYAKKRVVFDYRSPIDCFENEIFPYMKYELAKAISDDATAKANCLEHNQAGKIKTSATTEEEFKTKLGTFFATFPVMDSAKKDELIDNLTKEYKNKSGEFNFHDFDALSKDVWKGYTDTYEANKLKLVSGAPKSGKFMVGQHGVYQLLNSLRAEMGVKNNGFDIAEENDIKDKPGDYLYYPEMTTNGMFTSEAILNNEFYAGPDYIKIYNEMGKSTLCYDNGNGIGIVHSRMSHMIHRLYGSEINLRTNDKEIQILKPGHYTPPTRRKIYDTSLPRLGVKNSKFEIASYLILSWKDYKSSVEEFDNF